MPKIESSSREDALLDWQAMADMFAEQACWLLVLSDWQIALLLSLLRYAHWSRRWINWNGNDWDTIEADVTETERCLMSGCDMSNLTDLIEDIKDAITALTLSCTCAPEVKVTIQPPTIVGGLEEPSEAGEAGGEPPPGWIDPEAPDPDDRRCKVANLMYDHFVLFLETLDAYGFEDILGLGVGASLAVMITMLTSTLVGGPFTVAAAILGAVLVIVSKYAVETINLPGFINIMEDVHEDFVCALYTATGANEARAAAKDVIEAGGANASQSAFMVAVFIVDALNSLWFKKDDMYGDELEQTLDGYSGTIDCSVCVPPPPWQDWAIERGEVYDYVDDDWVEVTAVWVDDKYVVSIYFGFDEDGNPVGEPVRLDSHTKTSGTISYPASDFNYFDWPDKNLLYSGDSPGSGYPYSDFGWAVVRSLYAFRIKFDYTKPQP